jgi:hypothetical protein
MVFIVYSLPIACAFIGCWRRQAIYSPFRLANILQERNQASDEYQEFEEFQKSKEREFRMANLAGISAGSEMVCLTCEKRRLYQPKKRQKPRGLGWS